jgi:hypothetical protein
MSVGLDDYSSVNNIDQLPVPVLLVFIFALKPKLIFFFGSKMHEMGCHYFH